MYPLVKLYYSSQILKDLISINTSFYLIPSLTHTYKFLLTKHSSNLGSFSILNHHIYSYISLILKDSTLFQVSLGLFWAKQVNRHGCLVDPARFCGPPGHPATRAGSTGSVLDLAGSPGHKCRVARGASGGRRVDRSPVSGHPAPTQDLFKGRGRRGLKP
jgi:hypothetical protein